MAQLLVGEHWIVGVEHDDVAVLQRHRLQGDVGISLEALPLVRRDLNRDVIVPCNETGDAGRYLWHGFEGDRLGGGLAFIIAVEGFELDAIVLLVVRELVRARPDGVPAQGLGGLVHPDLVVDAVLFELGPGLVADHEGLVAGKAMLQGCVGLAGGKSHRAVVDLLDALEPPEIGLPVGIVRPWDPRAAPPRRSRERHWR